MTWFSPTTQKRLAPSLLERGQGPDPKIRGESSVAEDVKTARNHVTVSPAMRGFVHKPHHGFAVDKDVAASGTGLVGVGATTCGMNSGVTLSHGVETVDKNVIGSADHGARAYMTAPRASVRIGRN